jgi:serine/threonine protein kinase
LLNPPLGQGAFGEVRKAIHIESGHERAVKLIYKEKSNPFEIASIKNEVFMLFLLKKLLKNHFQKTKIVIRSLY